MQRIYFWMGHWASIHLILRWTQLSGWAFYLPFSWGSGSIRQFRASVLHSFQDPSQCVQFQQHRMVVQQMVSQTVIFHLASICSCMNAEYFCSHFARICSNICEHTNRHFPPDEIEIALIVRQTVEIYSWKSFHHWSRWQCADFLRYVLDRVVEGDDRALCLHETATNMPNWRLIYSPLAETKEYRKWFPMESHFFVWFCDSRKP